MSQGPKYQGVSVSTSRHPDYRNAVREVLVLNSASYDYKVYPVPSCWYTYSGSVGSVVYMGPTTGTAKGAENGTAIIETRASLSVTALTTA